MGKVLSMSNHFQVTDHQTESYKLIYTIENALRLALHNYLIKNNDKNYFNKNTFGGEKGEKIINTVNLRMAQAEKYGNLIKSEIPHFWYLDLGILADLMDDKWEDFSRDIFKPNIKKENIIGELKNIIDIRNSIAHNRPITNENYSELTVIKRRVIDQLRKKYIKNFNSLTTNDLSSIFKSLGKILEDFIDKINRYEPLKLNSLQDIINTIELRGMGLDNYDYDSLINDLYGYNKIGKYSDYGKKIKDYLDKKNIISRIVDFKKIIIKEY